MPINLRDDVAYILLKKIEESEQDTHEKHGVQFSNTDFAGRSLTVSDFLGHLDYLNQKGFIDADFSGNAYARQEDVPDLINLESSVDLRIANTLGAEDGPLPHLITFDKATLTDKGQHLVRKMDEDPPEALRSGPARPIATENMDFLEKVRINAELEDIFDARDLSEVIFRTMRDLMSTEATRRVTSELGTTPALETENKALQNDIAELWRDTNPIVRFLSKVRPPLEVDSETFFFRIAQEGGLPRGVSPKKATAAVFSAVKDELSQERISEISSFLPEEVQKLWVAA
ncbi:MAG: DUF2267 domain-containing protein [Leptolyngbyaceae bacterium]|nr:DUF2267 domain-containing protein [Leptolyngbyaceae bacterium]